MAGSGDVTMNIKQEEIFVLHGTHPEHMRFEVPVSFEGMKNPLHTAIADTGATSSSLTTAALLAMDPLTPINSSRDHVAVTPYASSSILGSRINLKMSIPVRSLASHVMVEWTFILVEGNTPQILLGIDIMEHIGMVQRVDNALVLSIPVPGKADEEFIDDGDDIASPPELLSLATPLQKELGSITYTAENEKLQQRLRAAVEKYSECINPELPVEGSLLPEFDIELVPNANVAIDPPRPIHPNVLKACYATIEEGLRTKRMESAEGPTCVNAVPVPKTGSGTSRADWKKREMHANEIRLCSDMRSVNKHTIKFPAPMPNLRDILIRATGHKYYCKSDLRSAYMQMRLTSRARRLTGTRCGMFYIQHRFVPFGTSNAPNAFQKAMIEIYADLIARGVMYVFIDDLIWWANQPDELVQTTEVILQRLVKYRLRIKAAKTYLGVSEIEAVGHILSTAGRRLGLKAFAAIAELNPPKTLEQLRKINGLFIWVHDYIEHCAEILAPLTDLATSTDHAKKRVLEWLPIHDKALSDLKNGLLHSTMLAAFSPSPEHELILRTDASTIGVGGALLARDRNTGAETPICFFSKKFTGPQLRWHTIEQELYAVVYSLQQPGYGDLLKCYPFTLETDHRNLVYLDRLSDESKKLLHWKLMLMEYNFVVKHIPGHTNTVADALSRLFGDDGTATPIRAMQTHDINEPHRRVIMMVHDGISGHYGVKKTMERIQDMGIAWPSLEADVKEFVQACFICRKVKPHNIKLKLGSHIITQPFLMWAVDTMGPFPCTSDGFMYIIVVIDLFSRWVELIPAKTLTAMEAADRILHTVYLRHGLPKFMKSDRGTQFINELTEKLFNMLGISQYQVTPYSPQANGAVERVNKEVVQALVALLYELGKTDSEWDVILPMVQHILNHTKHGSTGYAPYEILYGQPADQLITSRVQLALLPELSATQTAVEQDQNRSSSRPQREAARNNVAIREAVQESMEDEESSVLNSTNKTSAYMQILRMRLRDIYDRANKLQTDACIRRSNQANKSREDREFNVGDLVILLHPNLKANKLQPAALGPYRVLTADKTRKSYRIASIVDPSKEQDVHADKLINLDYTDIDIPVLTRLARHDAGEQEVAEILGHSFAEQGKQRRMLLRVRWADGTESNEPLNHVKHNDKAEAYLQSINKKR